jgi:tetratricopeptide (TPR) repeat protein
MYSHPCPITARKSASSLAVIALSRNNVRKAHDYFDDALNDAKQASNLGAGDRAAMYAVQGNIAAHDRDFTEAVKAYQRSIDLWMSVQGRESSVVAWEHALRGDAYLELGDLPEANKDLSMALGMLEEANTRSTPLYLQIELLYARLLRAIGEASRGRRMEVEARTSLLRLRSKQCIGCSVSVEAFK